MHADDPFRANRLSDHTPIRLTLHIPERKQREVDAGQSAHDSEVRHRRIGVPDVQHRMTRANQERDVLLGEAARRVMANTQNPDGHASNIDLL